MSGKGQLQINDTLAMDTNGEVQIKSFKEMLELNNKKRHASNNNRIRKYTQTEIIVKQYNVP